MRKWKGIRGVPYINIQGKNMYYDQNSDFQADLPTVLFVHGAGGSGKKWTHQLGGIQGCNLIAPDLPGHGRSEGSAADNIIAYCEFVWSFAQALNLKKFIIAGHSMGGGIALELGLAYPEAAYGLIIVASGARLRVNPGMLDALTRGEHPIETIKYQYSPKINPDVLVKAAEEMKTIPTNVYLADFRACNNFDIIDRINNISNPALIICGQDDQMTPLKYSEFLHKELSYSTIVRIPEAGHMVMLEKPDQVNEAISDFSAQISSKE
ncbi:putative hydrolase or acyltransferase of alpha/beta superfamily [Desulfosporosinus youngiae DSM 17734]|uniref:Putative hydrolase or acyltransferase of alpha/beta superfamily n=1 Tax=Desulfosporosinus youngiae DSM 17734 TaxID=768710 RepID=H5XVI2_9FIRM|nr:putative hydrolase or acyltransferase of alpha/beta superfamily [Desulfosporosinus youngiae DSM 17734]